MTDRSRRLTVILVCGSVIVMLAMGIRHGLGLFLLPMSLDFGWNRGVFSLALAVQNLLLEVSSQQTRRGAPYLRS